MQGLVFTNFIDYVEGLYGYEVIDAALNTLKLVSKDERSPFGYSEFDELAKLIGYVAKLTGIDDDQIVYDYGKSLFKILYDAHPTIVQKYTTALDLLTYIEGHIHYEVQKLYPEVMLPNIEVISMNNGSVIELSYSSHRPLAWLFRGLVEGCLIHFESFTSYQLSHQLSPKKTEMYLRLTLNEYVQKVELLSLRLKRLNETQCLSDAITNERISELDDSVVKIQNIAEQNIRAKLVDTIQKMINEPHWCAFLLKISTIGSTQSLINEAKLEKIITSKTDLERVQILRLRGDEYFMGLRLEAQECALVIAELLRKEILLSKNIKKTRSSCFSSASISYTNDTYQKSLQDIMMRLSNALLKAKSSGGNTIFSADEHMEPNADMEISGFSPEIYHSILSGEFWYQFQPIYDVTTLTILSSEALIRTNLEISHRDFISNLQLLLQSHEAIEVKSILLTKIIDQLRKPENKFIKHISINCDLFELENKNIYQTLLKFVQNCYKLDVSLTVEILENFDVDLSASPVIHEHIIELKSFGVRIALDDFGMMHSNLSRLIQLDVDCVKIDRALISSIDTDPKAQAVVSATKNLCMDLGINIVAEGVETIRQQKALISIGINSHQGFLYL